MIGLSPATFLLHVCEDVFAFSWWLFQFLSLFITREKKEELCIGLVKRKPSMTTH